MTSTPYEDIANADQALELQVSNANRSLASLVIMLTTRASRPRTTSSRGFVLSKSLFSIWKTMTRVHEFDEHGRPERHLRVRERRPDSYSMSGKIYPTG